MGKYIFKRILMFIPVVLAVGILIFTIMYFVPGDPAKVFAGAEASEEQLQAVREQLGLNQPYIVRLGNFLSDTFLHFDFGESYITGVKISDELMRRLPRTLTPGVTPWLSTLLHGVPIGVAVGVYQNKFGVRRCLSAALF